MLALAGVRARLYVESSNPSRRSDPGSHAMHASALQAGHNLLLHVSDAVKAADPTNGPLRVLVCHFFIDGDGMIQFLADWQRTSPLPRWPGRLVDLPTFP